MTEEQLTKTILKWLTENDWIIVSYDFPQSGTGTILHPKKYEYSKNKGGLIPDIVAVKNKKVVLFENKDRFVFEDYSKIEFLKSTDLYLPSIRLLLKDFEFEHIYYGIAIPKTKRNMEKNNSCLQMIDFSIMVDSEKTIEVVYESSSIFD